MKGRCACSLFGIYWELLTKTACLQRAFAAFLPLDFTANSNNTANSRDGNCSETAVLPITGVYGKTIFLYLWPRLLCGFSGRRKSLKRRANGQHVILPEMPVVSDAANRYATCR